MEKLKNTNMLDKLNSSELKKILSWLKLYSDLTKKLWNRWKIIFNNILSWKDFYKVEYTSAFNKEKAWEESKKAYLKAFWNSPLKDDIVFIENNSILWGIKIFKNDEMVDLSLSKAIDQIK